MRLAALLRQTRLDAGLSYRQLARGSGVSHAYLSHVEKGERNALRARAAMDVANALGASRTSFAVAAIADRLSVDVAAALLAEVARGPVGWDVDPTAGGVLIESGPPDAAARLAVMAARPDAAVEIARRLTFVDLQFDVHTLRTGIIGSDDEDPTVVLVSAPLPAAP